MSKTLKIVTATSQFTLRYNPHQVPSPTALLYMTSPSNPLRPKITHMYATRDRNTLWWRVSVNQLSFKKVVRSWCARRVRAAFRQALLDRGFDGEGRKIVQDAEGGPKVETGLKGTAEIIVHPASIKAEHADVQKEINSLVDTLLQKMNDPSWLQKMFGVGAKGKGGHNHRQHKTSKNSNTKASQQ